MQKDLLKILPYLSSELGWPIDEYYICTIPAYTDPIHNFLAVEKLIISFGVEENRLWLSQGALRAGETGQHCLPNSIVSIWNQALPFVHS